MAALPISIVSTAVFNENPNMNGRGEWIFGPDSTTTFNGNFVLGNRGEMTANGTLNYSGNFNTNDNTSLINNGTIVGTGSNGIFNPNGFMINNGVVDVEGFININSSSNVENQCSFIARFGFNNNSPLTENYGIILTTDPNSNIQINQPLYNAPGGYFQTNGVNGDVNFVNNANSPGFHGGGSVYVEGKSRNQGVFRGDTGFTINFYDNTPTGNQVFDQQNQAPVNTTRIPISPITPQFAAQNCFTSPVVTPPNAIDDTNLNNAPNTAVTTNVLNNDVPGGLAIAPSQTRILNQLLQPVTSYTVSGQGTWSVNTSNGAITFVPVNASVLTPSPITYRAVDTNGNFDNATLTVTYGQQQAVLSATKTASVASIESAYPCEVLSEPLQGGFHIPGSCIEYVITITNNGTSSASQVTVTDILETTLIFKSAVSQNFGPGTLTLPVPNQNCSSPCAVVLSNGTLNINQTGTIRIRAEIQ